jgi:hypothetical protein
MKQAKHPLRHIRSSNIWGTIEPVSVSIVASVISNGDIAIESELADGRGKPISSKTVKHIFG